MTAIVLLAPSITAEMAMPVAEGPSTVPLTELLLPSIVARALFCAAGPVSDPGQRIDVGPSRGEIVQAAETGRILRSRNGLLGQR